MSEYTKAFGAKLTNCFSVPMTIETRSKTAQKKVKDCLGGRKRDFGGIVLTQCNCSFYCKSQKEGDDYWNNAKKNIPKATESESEDESNTIAIKTATTTAEFNSI